MTLLAECCLVFLVFVSSAVILLWFFPFTFIDIEEIEFGTLPIALIDGEVDLRNILAFQVKPREGSKIILGLPIAFFFKLLGPTLLTLKLFAILLTGVWAAVWYYLARSIHGSLPRAYLGALFAIPLPLIQLASLALTNMISHLGSSLWHGVTLLLLCQRVGSESRVGNLRFFFSGLVCGVGIYYSYSFIPLLSGIFWLAWRLGGTRAAAYWLAGVAPTMPLTIMMFDIEPLAQLSREDVSGWSYLLILIKMLMLYGAGYVTLPSGNHAPYYSELSVIYALGIIVLGMIYGYRFSRDIRGTVTGSQRLVYESLGISTLGYFLALFVTRYEFSLTEFDGLRYFYPLAPMVLFLFLEGVRVLRAHHAKIALQSFLMLNLIGWIFIAYPFSAAEHLGEVTGYSYLDLRHYLRDAPLNHFYFGEVRQYQKAFGAGMAQSERNGHSASWDDYETSFTGKDYTPQAIEEYWRGVGYALADSGRCTGEKTCTLKQGAPKEVQHLNWQGAAVLLPCVSNLLDMIEETSVDFHEDIVRGLARGVKWNPGCYDGLPDFVKYHPGYEPGVREGWILDFSPHPPTEFSEQGKFENLSVWASYNRNPVVGTWGN